MTNTNQHSDAPEPPHGAESVDALGPGMGGRWLVRTRSSRHVWDLLRHTYQRLPGATSNHFAYDGEVVRIGRVAVYPRVGGRFLVYYDDPCDEALEQYRLSGTVRSITRLPATGSPDEPAVQ